MTGAKERGRRLFCFGYGYTAAVLGDHLAAAGWSVAGSSRDGESVRAVASRGIEAHRMSRADPLDDPARALAGTTHLLSSVPPDEAGDAVLDRHAGDIGAIAGLSWIGYLSTTGVYGDRDGGWVDESAVTAPSGPRGSRRVAAERAWRAFGARHGIPVHVFRLAGIYGPGRNAIGAVRAGTAKRIDRPGHAFTRIHVDDIAAVLMAAMIRPSAGAVYNVCDDEPAPAAAVITYACHLLGVAPPPLVALEDAALSPMARSFYADNRRVSNARMKRALGIALRYPDYRAGLRALLAGEAS